MLAGGCGHSRSRPTGPGTTVPAPLDRVHHLLGEVVAFRTVMTAVARRFLWQVGANTPVVADALRRAAAGIGRFLCGLSGHDMLRHFEPDRLSLQCARCGAQTPGWTIDVNPAFRRRTALVAARRDLTLVATSAREQAESRSQRSQAA